MDNQLATSLAGVPTIADLVSVTEIMTRDVTYAGRELDATRLVELMVRKRIGCIPVVDQRGHPIGMITKLDVVEQMLVNDRGESDNPTGKSLAPKTATELMMPLAMTLGEHATVAHVTALMANEDIHHIPIVDDNGCLVGIVSTMDVVRWLARNDGFASR